MSTPRRLLAIKLADLGDVLNITPALRALRHRFPQARIEALVNPHTAPVLQGSPLVDEVVVFPKTDFEGLSVLRPRAWHPLLAHLVALRRRGYDTIVNFHHLTTALGRLKQRLLIAATGAGVTVGLDNGHGRWFTHPVPDEGFGARREVEYWLALAARLGAVHPDTSLHLPVSAADHAAAAARLAQVGLNPQGFVVLHPGSGGYAPARRWEPPKFAALAVALYRRYGLPAVVVGTATDDVPAVLAAGRSPLHDFSSRLTIRELAAVIARAALFVGADSGVMHIAAAMGTPLVAIFGPTNPLAWAPWTPRSPARVVRLGISCSPCAYVGHRVGRRHGCPERACLADLDVAEVLAAASELLADRRVTA